MKTAATDQTMPKMKLRGTEVRDGKEFKVFVLPPARRPKDTPNDSRIKGFGVPLA